MIGVANNMETVRWLYSKHFSAVAGDTMGWEAWPYPEDCCLHEWLLCQWGTPIGELWNLEQLSVVCEELKRWSFFLTSAPIHVIGAVGSPPCVIAVF
jgi:kynurenine formamidase